MKEVIGVKYNTSSGTFIVLDEFKEKLRIGDEIIFDGKRMVINKIQAPTKPDAKWSIQVDGET